MSLAPVISASAVPDERDPNDIVVLPPSPRCRKCGHVMCPFCLTSCDEYVPDESADAEPGDMDPCCEGECDVSADAVEKWKAQIAPILDSAPQGAKVTVAEGPCEWG